MGEQTEVLVFRYVREFFHVIGALLSIYIITLGYRQVLAYRAIAEPGTAESDIESDEVDA